jgi:hypothetical protein
VNRAGIGAWALRIVWATLPLTTGPAVGGALDPRSLAVARTGAAIAWVVWAAGLLAVVVPRSVGCTLLRTAAPAVLVAAVWAAVEGDDAVAAAVAVAAAAVALLVTYAPATGDWLVNGSSYGDERRMPLRAPTPILLGAVQLTWCCLVAPVVAGPLLLASRQWVAGTIVVALGLVGGRSLAKVLHALSRRWVVFVPAGVVLHDHLVMLDPVLFPRSAIERLGPAPADAPATEDLTGGALGLALQLDLRDTLQVAPRRGRAEATPIDVTSVRFTPTRPGALLAEARTRRLPVE